MVSRSDFCFGIDNRFAACRDEIFADAVLYLSVRAWDRRIHHLCRRLLPKFLEMSAMSKSIFSNSAELKHKLLSDIRPSLRELRFAEMGGFGIKKKLNKLHKPL